MFRFCPHCGAPLTQREIDGLPRSVCGPCNYVHFDGPIPVVGVIIRRGDEVLLVRQADYPLYVLVAGYLEAFESAEDAAAREVKEETGLDVAIERVLGTYSCRPIGKNMVFIVCAAQVTGGELMPSDELVDARWFPVGGLPDWPPELALVRAFADLASSS